MPLPRQKFREIVFQFLYAQDFASSDEEEMVPFLMGQLAVSKKVVRMAQERGRLIMEKKKEIDKWISEASTSYPFDRIPRVERNVLRLGVFEILFSLETPPKVVIAEAIRLSRKFATPEGATFVNAILDHIYQKNIDKEDPSQHKPIQVNSLDELSSNFRSKSND
jgi:N utilization substance protein B